ncbi:ribosome-associated protein [Allofrancisella inopinata]|uniref:Dual-action ribosomal maturation protein DarP n=1 Tax=Allofrancisella inopinata TaxID=1085647 RepID=A0AAE6YJY2_9GAMM|nr:ribosome biogenesis factor YjgA [Allofrancisella inopinata]QIV96219.1 ribosome-associated protein [Allofrancisella inopinata]TDT74489.1 ribosome-associated protein [Allofrancisella inopinata]
MGKVIDLDEVERLEREEENSHYRLSRSKTSVKKDMLEITDFGKALIDLSNQQLGKLPISDNLRDNILAAKSMQKIALKRQIQFIGKLLRKVDNLDEIQKAYDIIINKDKQANLLFHRLENIRDNLLDSDKDKSNQTLDNLIVEFPDMDIQKLRQLIRSHYKEAEKNKPKKSYREIFQLIKELHTSNN